MLISVIGPKGMFTFGGEKFCFTPIEINKHYGFSDLRDAHYMFQEEHEGEAWTSCYKNYVLRLRETGKKAAIGVAAAVGATALTGGLALAFAPEIAVVLAGEAVAGLSGAAATNAALATIGGGALAAGGLGMAGGTAILTGGGAILGLAGAGSTSLMAVMSQTSEKFTLNECAKLLTFCKLVIVDKYDMRHFLNLIIAGVEGCVSQIESELDDLDTSTKEGKKSKKRIESSLKYLKNCIKELCALIVPNKKVMPERVVAIGDSVASKLGLPQKQTVYLNIVVKRNRYVVLSNDLVMTLDGRYGESKGVYYVPLG